MRIYGQLGFCKARTAVLRLLSFFWQDIVLQSAKCYRMPRKKKLTIKPPSQLETLKTTPSELAKQALLKSGAGAHGERKKRSRQKDRQEEIQATLEGDVEE